MKNAVGFKYRSHYLAAVFLAALLCTPLSVASSDTTAPIKGLVINETKSYKAQHFYQAFCLAWHEQRNASQFNVVLKEINSPRYGRQVQVLYDRQVAYVAAIPSGNSALYSLAEEAATNAIYRIQNQVLQEATYHNPDLAVDEI